MNETRNIICISCPLGCHLTVTREENGIIKVEGNTCPNGEKYGIEEVTDPRRIVPSTVVIKGGKLPRLPVKTSEPIPKGMIFDVMREINNAVTEAPVDLGDVIIENILGTGADIVATRSMDKA